MKLLIVDDHALFRESLRHILLRLDEVVDIYEAGSVEQALELQRDLKELDLILLDLQLPGLNGLGGMVALQKCFPTSLVVLLSGSSDPLIARDAAARGAQGFISKSVSVDAMLSILRRVMDGEMWIQQEPDAQQPKEMGKFDGASASLYLTPRQRDVLSQLAQGSSNKEIGRLLQMSENTVRSHLAGVFRALGAKSRTEAVVLAKHNGLL